MKLPAAPDCQSPPLGADGFWGPGPSARPWWKPCLSPRGPARAVRTGPSQPQNAHSPANFWEQSGSSGTTRPDSPAHTQLFISDASERKAAPPPPHTCQAYAASQRENKGGLHTRTERDATPKTPGRGALLHAGVLAQPLSHPLPGPRAPLQVRPEVLLSRGCPGAQPPPRRPLQGLECTRGEPCPALPAWRALGPGLPWLSRWEAPAAAKPLLRAPAPGRGGRAPAGC